MAENMRFKPHYNHAMGKKYHTAEDYVKDMNKMGLEPYKESQVKKIVSKPYKLDQKATEMIHQAAEYDRTGKKPGSRFIDAYNKLGIIKAPKNIPHSEKGGFYNE